MDTEARSATVAVIDGTGCYGRINNRGDKVGDLGGDLALSLTSDMLWTAVKLAAPLIGATMLVGLLVSVLQVVTQIQESSLSFVPKLIVATAVLLVLGGWMLSTLASYATNLIANIPSYF